jgi:hypothetical protein
MTLFLSVAIPMAFVLIGISQSDSIFPNKFRHIAYATYNPQNADQGTK